MWAGSDTVGFSSDYCATSKSTNVIITPDPTVSVITLNGTLYKNGQYVDPATLTLRNCVSPSYWMKEGVTSSGARGFHCMPVTSGYTLTSDNYPPASCTGTLWAGSDSTTTTFSSDYCATSKSTTTPPPTPVPTTPKQCTIGETCASGSWCNNGKQCYYSDGSLTCAAWAMGGNNNCADVAPVPSVLQQIPMY